jgi:hypothetical protein
MCSAIIRERGSVLLVVKNLPCCIPLERVTALDPSICAARGWKAVGNWSQTKKRVQYIELPYDLTRRLGGSTPIAQLEYKRRVVHFRSQEQIRVTRDFIAARLRRAQDYREYCSFLQALPAEMIAARARTTVTRRLDALLACYADGR